MAKKNHTLGKLFALTTTAAAIGGVCYVFRDQIKQSSVYKKSTECLSTLFEKVSNKFCQDEDDFSFDDEEDDDTAFDDIFSEDAKKNREYTSITINQKEDENPEDSAVDSEKEEENSTDISADEEETSTDTLADKKEAKTTAASETEKEETITATAAGTEEAAAPAESYDNVSEPEEDIKEIFSDDSIPTITFGNNLNAFTDSEESSKVDAYENEGLSDVSEDPDVLEEQDKLDY